MRENYFECKVLSEKIKEFKERNNLTYQQMGDALNVDKSYLNRVVKLDSYSSLPVLIRLARYMGIPLYALFMPSDELIRHEFIESAKQKISELNLTYDALGEQTNISPIRLMELFDGKSMLNNEERNALATTLDIPGTNVYHEDKMAMLETLIAGLDLQDTQKENVLRYIKDNLK